MKFVALPVPNGDSFYLETANHSYLVDGGKGSYLPALFRKHINKNHIHTVICTHKDNDHSDGILALLGDRSIDIDEIWIPGHYSYSS